MNMKKVIMMFALMTGTISAFAQNADSTSVEGDNSGTGPDRRGLSAEGSGRRPVPRSHPEADL